MTRILYDVGRFCVRRRWAVVAVWLAIFAVMALAARVAGSKLDDNLALPGSDSQQALDLLAERFPSQANGLNPVVLEAPAGAQLDEPRFRRAIDETVAAFRRDADVRDATSPLSAEGARQLAEDGATGYIALNLRAGLRDLSTGDAQRLVREASPARDAGMTVSFGGYVGDRLSLPDTHASEAIGVLVAVAVLLLTFGTAVATGVPIVTGIVGLVTGLSMIGLVGQVASIPTVAPTLATMIGLGVGIDYALFIVTRHQRQRQAGIATEESIARAVATSGAAVVFAGATVTAALLSLSVVNVPLVATLGYTAALVVAVTVVAAVTLLPAVLGVVGQRIDALALPWRRSTATGHPSGWTRWADTVTARPLPLMLVASGLLVALAVPTLGLSVGQYDIGARPASTEARQAHDALSAGFGPGVTGPLLVSVDLARQPARDIDEQVAFYKRLARRKADEAAAKEAERSAARGTPPAFAQLFSDAAANEVVTALKKKINARAAAGRKEIEERASDPSLPAPLRDLAGPERLQRLEMASDARLRRLRRAIAKTGGVEEVTNALVNSSGSAAILVATPTTAPSDAATERLLSRLRDDVIPAATKRGGFSASVGGMAAGYVDLSDAMASHLVVTILVVVALSVLLLMLAFRSVVIPLTAALMNLLSIGAAFGVLTAVFERGWGAGLVGLPGPVTIVSFVPLMMFAILFGLSMDYQVFLIARMKEVWERTGDNSLAVKEGLASTGRVITSAALIMVGVFVAFVINADPTVKQFGVGMAVAVAVDATVVRCVLVPTVMTLLGPSNWWFPRRLERLVPDLSIEGDDWFHSREVRQPETAVT